MEMPELRPASTACIDALHERLGATQVFVDAASRTQASRDHAWLSPILTAAIPDGAVADVVVRPRTVDALRLALAIAHDHDVAVTPRGKGTGNYGQSVPLAQGIVLDTTAFDGAIEVHDGWLDAGAGATFSRLEAAARRSGQELAMFPSTTGSVLGGFLAGGAGGTGSIENGMLWDGYVDELAVMPCWDAPEVQVLRGDAARPHLHAYGTTGVTTAARIRLVPARRWTALFASFATIGAASEAGLALLTLDPKPRNLSADDVALTELLAAHPAMPAGRVSLRAIVAESTVAQARREVAAAGGEVEAVLRDATSLCVSLSFNHVTLRAKRVDPAVCHVQVAGPVTVDRYAEVCATLPDARLHLDAMTRGEDLGYGGLLIATFVDEDTLRSGMERLRDLGVVVTDPHTWELGGHGSLDPVRATAAAFDPKGLLNPGKLPRARAGQVA